MAEGEEKSFPATPQRRAEARKKGQMAKSSELGPAVTMMALVIALHNMLPGGPGQQLFRDLQSAFQFNSHDMVFDFATAQRHQMISMIWAGRFVLPFMLIAVVAGLCTGVGQVGFGITPEALSPKWERINPASGIKRILSTRGTVELLKGIVKMAIVAMICQKALMGAIDSGDLMRTMRMGLAGSLQTVGELIWTIGIRVSSALFFLAVADYAYQKYDFEKSIKMSITEIKQEMKQSDGDPQIKAKIRRLQREMARRRMMQDVPHADVIVTNPTHFAVALQYEAGASAPKVVAKGQDEIALRIREIAKEHGVPIVENKPLARALHKDVEIGQDIPGELYEGVAQVLAFVYRTYGRRKKT